MDADTAIIPPRGGDLGFVAIEVPERLPPSRLNLSDTDDAGRARFADRFSIPGAGYATTPARAIMEGLTKTLRSSWKGSNGQQATQYALFSSCDHRQASTGHPGDAHGMKISLISD